jgi:RHS repeat-associated protein
VSNPLIAQKQDSTNWHTGINLIDDAAACYDGVSSGSWVEGGIGAIGAGLDLLTVAMNPVGTLISYGLNWLIEHVKPLKDALDQLAGDADQIAAYSATWANVGKAVDDAAKNLSDAVGRDLADWAGPASDAYRQHAQNMASSLQTAATCANTISTAVKIVGVITGAVRGLVRDMVTQAIGDFIQDALEEVFSLGLGTPVVVAQVVEQVAQWTEKIGAVIKKLINSVEALRPLMSKLEELWGAVQKIMAALHGHVEEPHIPGEGTHVSSAEPHTSTGPHESAPHDGTAPSGAHDPSVGDGTAPSSAHDGTHTSGSDGTPTREPGGGQKSEGNGGCDGKGGDPVDTVSGQMITSDTDVALPGLLPLTLLRAYASDYEGGNLHGPGWSATMDQRLELDATDVRYFGDDAQVLRYPYPGADGVPVMPRFGARWPLRWDADTDTYVIHDPETGWSRHFAASVTDGVRPITALTDRNGHRITYEHDERGLPTAVRHSGGYHVVVDTVDGPSGPRLAGYRVVEDDRAIPVVSFEYDARGRLTGIINSSGMPFRYEHDDADRITGWTDRNGYRYQYFYREDGRVARGEGLGGFLNATFEYDLANRISTVVNSLGHTTRFHYDEHDHITQVVDPLGNVERTEFDMYHRLLSYTDPLGNTTRWVRNEHGDPVRVEFPDGTSTSVDYDERWLMPTRIAEPGGAVWQHRYNDTGNLVETTDPVGATFTSTVDERGHVVTTTEPDGRHWLFASNGAGRPLSATAPTGATSRYDIDGFGRLRTMTDAHGATTRYGWTVEGRLAWQITPDGEREELHYDPEGNLVRSQTATGAVVTFQVGPFNLPITRTGEDGTRYTFAYDTELRLVRVTNPLGLTWDYEYDPAGNLVRESDFTGRAITYRYDAAKRQVARSPEVGQTITFVRDARGRVLTQEVEGEEPTRFEYDEAGRVRRARNGATDLSYQRDLMGRPLVESVNGRAVRSEFDLMGRRVRRSTPSGVESVWRYTPLRQAASLAGTAGALAFEHDPSGREITRQFGTATLTQEYDVSGLLTAQRLWATTPADPTRRSIQQRTYHYRPDGLVTATTDQLRGNRVYELTPAGRVTAVNAASWTERYAYDALGNLAAADPGAPSDAAGPRVVDGFMLRSAGRSTYDYDAVGRLVRETRRTASGQRLVWTYTWNGLNQLVSVATPNGQRWQYDYDALGRRAAKRRLHEAGAVLDETTFSWDGANLAEEVRSTRGEQNALVTATTWDYLGATEPVAQTSRSWLAHAPSEIVDSRFHAIITDLVGTPMELVTPDGRVAWHQTSSLWGGQLSVSAENGVDCPLRFAGQYHDRETGLHYNFHRYYDPKTARYLTPDPLGLHPSPNHYAYVANPLILFDPFGLNPNQPRNNLGQYQSDPNRVPTVHSRDTEYPKNYADATHEHMVKNWTVEGQAAGKWPVDTSGVKVPRENLTWFDAQGNIIPKGEVTYDHNPPVVQHWIDEGHNQTAGQREAWYNKTDGMEAMSRSENSSKGAKLKERYSDKALGPKYSCS